MPVSVLFSEPKIPQSPCVFDVSAPADVSVLFSEPKIPQSRVRLSCTSPFGRFSALQRAENSSIHRRSTQDRARRRFQCSSASRKFLNAGVGRNDGTCERVSVLFSEPKIPQLKAIVNDRNLKSRSFSALQRAENSSIHHWQRTAAASYATFQCSSASRKFLNSGILSAADPVAALGFSALQRAENSSINGERLYAV